MKTKEVETKEIKTINKTISVELNVPESQEIIQLLNRVISRLDVIEKKTNSPVERLPELCSGFQIMKALGIGHQKLKRLIIAGLDDVSGNSNGHPKYRKTQLIKILENSKNIFS
ncbi:MAG: hypothetical protein GY730_04205 [bacterium]|nr:hypothetical protein [bacterium]